MLIPTDKVIEALGDISIAGALHVGAHDCEELGFYASLGLAREDLIWVDALPEKLVQAQQRGIPNVYNALVTDRDDVDTIFNIANNGQSSSVLELHTHKVEHPHITYVGQFRAPSITIDSFFARNGLDPEKYDFWNFDIQGAELMALRGASASIKHAKALYLEVNEKELYKGCGLISDIDGHLLPLGFKRTLTEMTRHGWGDALYIRS